MSKTFIVKFIQSSIENRRSEIKVKIKVKYLISIAYVRANKVTIGNLPITKNNNTIRNRFTAFLFLKGN